MTQYRFCFVKTLYDHAGHRHDCLEGEVRVRRAQTQERAVRAAQLKFQRSRKIPHWKIYADPIVIAQIAPLIEE